MGNINMGRVVIGGLVAGLLINVSEFLLNGVVLAQDMNDALKALNRSAAYYLLKPIDITELVTVVNKVQVSILKADEFDRTRILLENLFSFFLMAAALLLAALFFRLGIEQRLRQIGMLRALGFPDAAVRNLFLIEGALLALAGCIVGIVGATGYGALI